MYSWVGQLYTALRTGCQGINGMSAGLTGFSGIKNAYRGRKKLLDFVHELHELTRRLCAKKNGDRVGRTNCH